jgi:hypothetical protein
VAGTTTYRVVLTFTEDLLGTVAKDPQLYESYIASRAPKLADGTPGGRDEVETVPEARDEERGWTGFHHFPLPDGRPFLFDYQLKGFFKDAAGMLNRSVEREDRLSAHKKLIDGLVFVAPRRIPLHLPPGQTLGVLERPLRAQTAQGERVALARSDTAPAGTTLSCEVMVLGKDVSKKVLESWLDYGRFRGLGQWRSASWGRFDHTIEVAD